MGEYIDTRELIEERAAILDDEDATQEDREHAAAITALEEEGIEDWQYGATLIPVREFVNYAQELAEDIGAISSEASWPLYCIDWERAARELAMDYSLVTFEGTDYYVR